MSQGEDERKHVYLAQRMERLGWWTDALYALGFLVVAAIAFALAWNEGIWGALTKALDAIG